MSATECGAPRLSASAPEKRTAIARARRRCAQHRHRHARMSPGPLEARDAAPSTASKRAASPPSIGMPSFMRGYACVRAGGAAGGGHRVIRGAAEGAWGVGWMGARGGVALWRLTEAEAGSIARGAAGSPQGQRLELHEGQGRWSRWFWKGPPGCPPPPAARPAPCAARPGDSGLRRRPASAADSPMPHYPNP